MPTFTVHQAKSSLSQLLQRAARGEEVIIARGRVAVAKLVPIGVVEGRRTPGSLRGRLNLDSGFFEPLREDELAGWER